MNANQRIVLIAAAVVIGLMLLFPPLSLYDGTTHLGYGFLLSKHLGASINVELLLTQWLGVGAVAAVSWFLLRDSS